MNGIVDGNVADHVLAFVHVMIVNVIVNGIVVEISTLDVGNVTNERTLKMTNG